MKRKIMIAAVAAAVIFCGDCDSFRFRRKTPAINLRNRNDLLLKFSGGSWKDWKTGVSQMILPVFIQKYFEYQEIYATLILHDK